MTQRSLVLGAGGHAACAWQIGLITGLAEAGIDVRDADLFVGTSAGARVAIQITSGLTLEDLFQRQLDMRRQTAEAPAGIDWKQWRGELMRAKAGGGETAEVLRRIGAFAMSAACGSASERRKFVESQLPGQTWPEEQVLIATVEAESGERHVFDRASGIDLVDAVMASSAVAGMWPAVPFRGRHYIDGGFYSTDNADLAVGSGRVLIAALRSGVPPLSAVSLDAAVETLRKSGARVVVVHPDDATESAFASVNGNLLDPAVCEPAAHAGREQGRRLAREQVGTMWR
jgi:NTE family protein